MNKKDDEKTTEVITENLNENLIKEETTNTSNKKKINKKYIIVGIIILLLIATLIGLFVFFNNRKEDNSNYVEEVENQENNEENNNENQEENKEEEKEVKNTNTVSFYMNQYGSLCEYSNYCNTVAFTVETESKNIKIYDILGRKNDGYVLFKDSNTIKVFDAKNNKVTAYDLINPNYKKYYLIASSYENENDNPTYKDLLGINYNNEEGDYGRVLIGKDCKYYDVKDNKNKYNGICIDGVAQNSNYLTGASNIIHSADDEMDSYKYQLISNDKTLITINNANPCYGFRVSNNFITDGCVGGTNEAYYTKNGAQITDLIWMDLIDEYNNYLYYFKDGKIIKSNSNGTKNEISKYNGYDVKMISRNHAVATKDDKLIIINLDEEKEYVLGDWSNNYYFHSMISGYYSTDELANSNEKKAGYYLIME